MKPNSRWNQQNMEEEKIVIYQLEQSETIEVRVQNETVWLTQAQMALLFQRNISVISRHIHNAFAEGKLEEKCNLHFLQIANGKGVSATICVNRIRKDFLLDVERHNVQYLPVTVREIPLVHDRFLLLDRTRLYTFGASFKDLGKKLFCFSLMESETVVKAVRGLVDVSDVETVN